jgi:tetratricopeptide (TPR) repeat protein
VKHVWPVTRVALAALGLAFIAATPAVVAAAGVVSAWSLAGATAAAAGIVALGGIAQDRYRRQRASREEEILGGHDDGPVSARWKPPRVREITDPVRLGTHRAVPAENESAEGESVDPASGAEAPVYIPRDQDGELRELLATCGFVLLVGDSTAGKTRMAFEGMRATLPGHALIAPPGVAAIPLAISRAAEQPRCVLWLDDLERFLGPGGITAADIARLLGGSGQHRVIVATIRAVEQARLTADLRDDDRAWQGLRDVREVLDQARQIRIARMFTASELERARTRAWDPRIAEAIRHADRYGIAEYLAAGPPLLRDLHNARGSAAGTHPQGAAIVTAAIDLRRAGYLSPIPRDLLDEIHGHYLDGPNQSSTPRELLGEAWAWATTRRSATTRLLTPVGGSRVKVFDYLTDAAQRRAGPLDRVLEPVVRSALATAGASDANSLARTAYNQGRWQLAADAWQIACQLLASDPGVGEHHPDTLTCRGNLALVLQDLGRLDEAEVEDRTVLAERELLVGPDHPDTLASRGNLALVLRDLGRLKEARAEIRAVLAARRRVQGTDHPDTLASRGNLALVLRDLGRLEQAEDEIRAVLAIALRVLGPDHPRTLTSRNNLAVVLRDLGRLNEAVGEIRAVLAARQLVLGPDHPDSLASRNNLARVLRDLGWLDEAEAEIRAVLAIRLRVLGPDHRSTLASRNNLAGVLHERDRLVEAEAEIRAVLAVMLRVLGPDHPDTLACRGNLALVLRELGRLDEAEIEIPADLADPELALGADDFSTLAEDSASANGVPGTNGSAGGLSSSAGASLSAAGEADDHVNAELLAQQA